ncbi:bifunctional proline dehydrogenase/L-glutamate gamma-semialdehyde dehydrogenase [Luteolibacter pohnpeiensis]|uniref:L-glutamate gamma-semialdehyde dehydrogenase n=1 Tax=Luteolibacter pohnpeiensis TaxID=454153 RepID=A0A934VQM1_9BACT|nr:bifunctional proline dehydrogenase/L-glutamate gamma-semialdehyde dehydrogenase [Luteolibacter pohnpeiensis]MBK1882246.1 bifunctional proline dehydrogenase/L-glutamate gamma-semialdehyde dehydrogenase [Luteolibacter pohnpeiensis]
MNRARIDQAISKVKQHPEDDALLAEMAVNVAAELLRASQKREKWSEKRQGAQLARMMHDPSGKAFTLAMADQVFRPPSESRSAAQFRHLVDGYGVPEYLSMPERIAMLAGSAASAVAPEIVMPAITEAMRRQSASVILPAEERKLKPLLDKRHKAGMRMNLNQLGEAILGEEEAEKRIQAVIERIKSPDCDYLSVKISAIFSQIHLVGYDETLERIKDRLRRLYRVAIENPQNGKPKFVNLDMEEYRDLRLTCDAFRQVLEEPEFFQLEAGIVLQAYLPDSWPVQKELNDWARGRVSKGGAGIKIRIVKGANLAMESVDAEIHDWELAPYSTKEEVDANFKRMLHEGCRPENAGVVRLGVASHNLFDIAYALLLRTREGVEGRIEFEMLEGMANHQARTVHETAGGLLLYAPVVLREDFHSAIAYLVRRLDENTSEENFLHDLFGMKEGGAAWEKQKDRFLKACARKDTVAFGPRRLQDRTTEENLPLPADAPFHNAPDTDWSLTHNTRWARAHVEALRKSEIATVPLVIDGKEEVGESEVEAQDPSRPGAVPYCHALAGPEQIERALQAAVKARGSWIELGFEGRAELLRKVAAEIGKSRGEAIAAMVMDGGKAVYEADGEVSEAIDFANYYARSIQADGAKLEPFGTVLVTPPWNFPFAIPCGSILAALVAGNTVILKPAPETVYTAWIMVQTLWRAGIPKDVLQFVPCPDNEIGRSLVTDSRIGAVILTGAYETARMFLGWKPELRLFAETSGKNALIITAAADPDQAVKDLVKSAFGHSGQKCSAASLAIVEAEVYDSPGFRHQLYDAAASLISGSSWNFDATATPVIREPGDALMRALTTLDAGEEWLLKPEMVDGNPCLWTPGIKLGVSEDSWFRRTECFGPVLGVIRADNLKHAIRIQNNSEFGLTGGIHSLDDREIEVWKDQVEVGNAYINRPITGAIVQRQPFGGWKRSCFGPGSKAGGPNYVAQFGNWKTESLPEMVSTPPKKVADLLGQLVAAIPSAEAALTAAAGSDAFWDKHEFSVSHDPTAMRCEANQFRYRRFQRALIRVTAEQTDEEVARLLLAATAIGIHFAISSETKRPWFSVLKVGVQVESVEALVRRFSGVSSNYDLLRCPQAPASLRAAAIDAGMRLADGPVIFNAKLEWPAWHREQAVTETLHRYGNIVPKPY